MGITASIDISAEQRRILLDLLSKYLANTKVWAFGSRVKWTTRSNSDLDLVVFSSPEQDSHVSALIEALEESNLPFRVDLLVWDKLPENFQRNIEEGYVVLVGDDYVERDEVMGSDWPTVKLADIVDFKTGKLDSNEAEIDGIYPFFTCSPITYEINTYAFDTEAVLLAGNNASGIFSVKYYKGKFNAYQRTYVITPMNSKQVSVRWLYFRIKQITSELQQLSVGTSTKFLTKKILDAFQVNLPPYDLQEVIADILWSLQDKIDNNRQTNKTLEKIALALFKSWFVDFEPVKAKIAAKQAGANAEQIEHAALCAISGKTPEQLAQLNLQILQQLKTTAALFPDALVDSELGEIPEGWEIVRFKQIVEKYIDNRGKTPPIVDSGIPLLEVKHLPDHSIKPNVNTDKFVNDETYKTWFRAHLNSEDLIISTVGTIGRLCMVPKGIKIAIAQNLLGLRFDRAFTSPYFMYFLMDGKRFRDDVNNRLVITVQASIKRQDLETIDLLSPPITLQNKFESFVKPFVEMQQSDETFKLSQLRDSLLPKLLSGELL